MQIPHFVLLWQKVIGSGSVVMKQHTAHYFISTERSRWCSVVVPVDRHRHEVQQFIMLATRG